MAHQLRYPPLVEALLEIKWNLKQIGPDAYQDIGYKWASGRLYDKLKKRFSHIKDLPTIMIPEEMAAYAVRHQFRTGENGWPLIQFGPGIATVNFIPPYSWADFKGAVKFFIPKLVDAYQGVVEEQVLVTSSAALRYINGIQLDWSVKSTLEYLSDKLHTVITLPEGISADELISGTPVNINLQVGYPTSEPNGQAIVRFSNGTVGQSKGLILEILFVSAGNHAPQFTDMDNFMTWLTRAHDVIERWFFTFIEGELESQFKGEEVNGQN